MGLMSFLSPKLKETTKHLTPNEWCGWPCLVFVQHSTLANEALLLCSGFKYYAGYFEGLAIFVKIC